MTKTVEQADALGVNKTLTRLAKQAGLGTKGRRLVEQLWHETREEAHDQGLEPTSENFDIYIIRSIREKLGLAVDNDIGGGTINETVHPQARDLDLPAFAEEAKTMGSDRYTWHRFNGKRAATLNHRGNPHRLEPGDRYGVREATSSKAAKAGHHRLVMHKHGLTKVFTVADKDVKNLHSRSTKVRRPTTTKV